MVAKKKKNSKLKIQGGVIMRRAKVESLSSSELPQIYKWRDLVLRLFKARLAIFKSDPNKVLQN